MYFQEFIAYLQFRVTDCGAQDYTCDLVFLPAPLEPS